MNDATQQRTGIAAEVLGELQLGDYIAIIDRRKWVIILSVLGLTIATLVAVLRLPNLYRAETVILVDPQKIPDSYVPPTVTGSITDRLSTIQQEVMSPTRLHRLAVRNDLFPELQAKVDPQDIVARMQKNVTVDVVNQGGRQLSAFRISFKDQNASRAAQVANELAAMFIAENLKVREQQSLGTTEFIENELAKTKHDLDEKESQLNQIKSKFIMDLPDSKQFHLEALSSLRMQMRDSQEKVSRAQQERVLLQSMAVNNPPTVEIQGPAGGEGGGDSEVQRLETKLADLRVRYGPNFPDVRKVQAQLAQAKAREAQDKSDPAAAPQPTAKSKVRNPVLDSQVAKLNDEVAQQTKLQDRLQEQINFHMSKLEREPVFEQQIASLMRDYDTLRAHYTSLMDKKLSAEMSSNLETRQKGERFVILDAAQVPTRPYAPNRPLMMMGGLVAGIMAGLALAMLLELSNQSVRTELEARSILGKPVVAGIPRIRTQQERRLRQFRYAAMVVATVISSAGLGVVISTVGKRFM